MPANTIPAMPLTEFYIYRRPFEKSAIERRTERINHQDDTPHNLCVLEEMLMAQAQQIQSQNERITALEKLLSA